MSANLMEAVLDEILFEREQQDAKWGEQNHPDGTSLEKHAGLLSHYRNENAKAVKNGTLDWRLILLEEVYEAMTETAPVPLREELIQVAAVAAAWVECIDRRTS